MVASLGAPERIVFVPALQEALPPVAAEPDAAPRSLNAFGLQQGQTNGGVGPYQQRTHSLRGALELGGDLRVHGLANPLAQVQPGAGAELGDNGGHDEDGFFYALLHKPAA